MNVLKSTVIAGLIFSAGLLFIYMSKSPPQTVGLPYILRLDSGDMEYVEENGEITVTIHDIYDDRHVYRLSHEKVSMEDTLILLKSKQLELKEKKKTRPGG